MLNKEYNLYTGEPAEVAPIYALIPDCGIPGGRTLLSDPTERTLSRSLARARERTRPGTTAQHAYTLAILRAAAQSTSRHRRVLTWSRCQRTHTAKTRRSAGLRFRFAESSLSASIYLYKLSITRLETGSTLVTVFYCFAYPCMLCRTAAVAAGKDAGRPLDSRLRARPERSVAHRCAHCGAAAGGAAVHSLEAARLRGHEPAKRNERRRCASRLPAWC